MARINRTLVLSLLILTSTIFLLFQLYNYSYSSSQSGFIDLNNKGRLSGKEAHWVLLRRFLALAHRFQLPVFLWDPVALDRLSQDALLYRASLQKEQHCSFLCTHREFTSFALLASLWKYHASLFDAAAERGLELLEIDGKDPRLVNMNDLTAKEIPLHFLFRFEHRLVHVVMLYERSGRFLWHGPLRLNSNIDHSFAPFQKLDFGRYAGAYDRPELILSTVDGLDVRIPKNLSAFSHERLHSTFLECRSTEAKAFYQRYPEDSSPEAVDFKMRAKSLLHLASRVLFDLGIPFWLSSGTCLGWYRQCNIIPYSKDVDLGIMISDYRPDITQAFQRAGLPLKHKFGKVKDSLELSFQGNNIKLDIFFFYNEGDVVWNGGTQAKSGKKFKYVFPRFTLCWTQFLELKVRVPCETEEYLKANYGQDWSIPVKSWDWKSSPFNVQENGIWPVKEWDDVIQVY